MPTLSRHLSSHLGPTGGIPSAAPNRRGVRQIRRLQRLARPEAAPERQSMSLDDVRIDCPCRSGFPHGNSRNSFVVTSCLRFLAPTIAYHCHLRMSTNPFQRRPASFRSWNVEQSVPVVQPLPSIHLKHAKLSTHHAPRSTVRHAKRTRNASTEVNASNERLRCWMHSAR